MKQLKNILKYKYLLLIIVIIISLIRSNIPYKSIYNSNIKEFSGVIESYEYKDTYITFIINGKEKLKCNYYNDSKLNLNYGDKIYLSGTLKEPNNNTIPNTFNYKKYLNNNNIYYILEVENIKKIVPTRNILYKIKNTIQKRIDKYDKTGYLNAFILGNKKNIDEITYNNYSKNGIIHIFSISGMHISLLSTIIIFILNRIKKSDNNILIVIIFLIFYLIITNYQASILRSIVFFSILNISKLKKINLTTLDSIIISIILILLIKPKFIYNIGFLYSSIISFALILYNNKFNKNYFLNLLLISFVSMLISLPITININYKINILSILINLIFVPLVSFILYPLSLITFIFPIINPLFSASIKITEYLSNTISNVSLFNISIPRFTKILLLIYYTLVHISLSKNKKFYIILFLFLVFLKNINKIDNSYRIYYLDVGQGDMTVIKYKSECVVIDTGPPSYNTNYHITDNHIKFLNSIGVNDIDLLIITHGDSDHIGNANYLVNNFKVNKVILNNDELNELEIELINSLTKKNIKYYQNIKTVNIKNNKLYFLETNLYDNENDNSNVIYTKFYKYKFLFMGDAEKDREKEILDKYNISNIDVLKVGHHGSKTSSTNEFINKINPKYGVISVGKNNRYGHPNKETLENLKNSKIYRTDQDGSIMFKIKNKKLKIETCEP